MEASAGQPVSNNERRGAVEEEEKEEENEIEEERERVIVVLFFWNSFCSCLPAGAKGKTTLPSSTSPAVTSMWAYMFPYFLSSLAS